MNRRDGENSPNVENYMLISWTVQAHRATAFLVRPATSASADGFRIPARSLNWLGSAALRSSQGCSTLLPWAHLACPGVAKMNSFPRLLCLAALATAAFAQTPSLAPSTPPSLADETPADLGSAGQRAAYRAVQCADSSAHRTGSRADASRRVASAALAQTLQLRSDSRATVAAHGHRAPPQTRSQHLDRQRPARRATLPPPSPGR